MENISLQDTKIDLTACPAYQSLSLQHKKFVLEYFKSKFNATKAAGKAGYSKKTARSQGQRLLTNADIKEAIDEINVQISGADIASIEELARFLTSVMRGNLKDFVRWTESGHTFMNESDDFSHEQGRLIKRIKFTEKTSQEGDWTETKTEFELHDPLRAAEMLGRYHGMFVDKHEHSGPNGGPIPVEVVDYSKAVRPKNGASGS